MSNINEDAICIAAIYVTDEKVNMYSCRWNLDWMSIMFIPDDAARTTAPRFLLQLLLNAATSRAIFRTAHLCWCRDYARFKYQAQV